MISVERVGLTKLFLWSEAQRFQTYPKALARLTSDRTYTRQQIAEDLFGLIMRMIASRNESIC